MMKIKNRFKNYNNDSKLYVCVILSIDYDKPKRTCIEEIKVFTEYETKEMNDYIDKKNIEIDEYNHENNDWYQMVLIDKIV